MHQFNVISDIAYVRAHIDRVLTNPVTKEERKEVKPSRASKKLPEHVFMAKLVVNRVPELAQCKGIVGLVTVLRVILAKYAPDTNDDGVYVLRYFRDEARRLAGRIKRRHMSLVIVLTAWIASSVPLFWTVYRYTRPKECSMVMYTYLCRRNTIMITACLMVSHVVRALL